MATDKFKEINVSPPTDKKALVQLSEKIVGLGEIIEDSSKNSSILQKTLNFWTKVMAGAIIVQAIFILIQLLK